MIASIEDDREVPINWKLSKCLFCCIKDTIYVSGC